MNKTKELQILKTLEKHTRIYFTCQHNTLDEVKAIDCMERSLRRLNHLRKKVKRPSKKH